MLLGAKQKICKNKKKENQRRNGKQNQAACCRESYKYMRKQKFLFKNKTYSKYAQIH